MGTVPQEATRVQYLADGVADVFIYPFFIPLDVDITVWVTPAGSPPNETVDKKILNTNYTVQDAGVPGGGTITFLPGFIPGSGDQVTLSRAVEDSITTNYVDARTINGANLDESFEREMLVTQQNVTNLDQTALRYQNNAFLPDVLNRNILPTLDPNFLWKGSASGNVIAVEDKEEGGCSSLRSELASEVQGADGAGLVGYFDENRLLSTTVRDQLNEYGDPATGQDGARIIGYYDSVNSNETNVGAQLDLLTDVTDGLPDKLQNGFAVYGDDIGTPDNLVVNIIPSYVAYVPGTKVFVKVANNNATQTPTLNLNALGAKTIINKDGTPLLSEDLQANGIYEFVYDGVNFQSLTSPLHNRSQGEFSKLDTTSIQSSTSETSLLGTIAGSNVITPNYLVNGSTYKIEVLGDYENRFSSTVTIRLKTNAGTISTLSVPALASTGTILYPMKINITIVVRDIGSPATVYTRIDFIYDIDGDQYRAHTEQNVSTNFDTTILNALDVTFQFNVSDFNVRLNANSLNSIKLY